MSTALNSPEQRCLVKDVPYSAESGGTFIRTTPEERERYKRWEYLARAELELYEPAESRKERAAAGGANAHELVDREPHFSSSHQGKTVVMLRDDWRSYWRSLPDYDGGRNAPSGVRWWTDSFDNPRLLLVPMWPVAGADLSDIGWRNIHLSLGAEVHINLHAAARETIGQSLYNAPSLGGRGWCPKLAGVGE